MDVGDTKEALKVGLRGLAIRLRKILATKGGRYAFAFDFWKEMFPIAIRPSASLSD